jgi:receptor expression-enhancing protein 5/6
MIMGLFVPIFRVAMVFLNVWESYKTLKPPPPSKRNGGKPSVRAASQRKRDMKGCLTIWIVWVRAEHMFVIS